MYLYFIYLYLYSCSHRIFIKYVKSNFLVVDTAYEGAKIRTKIWRTRSERRKWWGDWMNVWWFTGFGGGMHLWIVAKGSGTLVWWGKYWVRWYCWRMFLGVDKGYWTNEWRNPKPGSLWLLGWQVGFTSHNANAVKDFMPETQKLINLIK